MPPSPHFWGSGNEARVFCVIRERGPGARGRKEWDPQVLLLGSGRRDEEGNAVSFHAPRRSAHSCARPPPRAFAAPFNETARAETNTRPVLDD
jgi:hypothetical protein